MADSGSTMHHMLTKFSFAPNAVSSPPRMLMCGKVTHKKLKDNQLTIPCLFIAKVLNLQFDLDKLVYYTYSVCLLYTSIGTFRAVRLNFCIA